MNVMKKVFLSIYVICEVGESAVGKGCATQLRARLHRRDNRRQLSRSSSTPFSYFHVDKKKEFFRNKIVCHKQKKKEREKHLEDETQMTKNFLE